MSGATCMTDEQCIDADDGFCNKNSVFSLGNSAPSTAFTRITPVDLDGGVLTVAEEVHFNNLPTDSDVQITNRAWAAWNPQAIGNRFDATDPARVDLRAVPWSTRSPTAGLRSDRDRVASHGVLVQR